MTDGDRSDAGKGCSPGKLTHVVVYAISVTAMYLSGTPEVTGNFTEGQEKDFHIAAASLAKGGNPVALSLAQLKAGKVDAGSMTFLLPPGHVKMDVPSDHHEVLVLERHADWQLVEYRYGNTHDSVSRYRAFKDRIEPVSYRITMHMGLFISALLLLIPTTIASSLVNAVWDRVARRKTSSEAV